MVSSEGMEPSVSAMGCKVGGVRALFTAEEMEGVKKGRGGDCWDLDSGNLPARRRATGRVWSLLCPSGARGGQGDVPTGSAAAGCAAPPLHPWLHPDAPSGRSEGPRLGGAAAPPRRLKHLDTGSARAASDEAKG